MTTAQQRLNRRSDRRFAAAAGTAVVSAASGLVLAVTGTAQGMTSTDQHGGGQAVMVLGGVLLVLGPAAVLVLAVARRGMRRYGAWKRTLTAEQRAALGAAQFLGTAGTWAAVHQYNQNAAARNTATILHGFTGSQH